MPDITIDANNLQQILDEQTDAILIAACIELKNVENFANLPQPLLDRFAAILTRSNANLKGHQSFAYERVLPKFKLSYGIDLGDFAVKMLRQNIRIYFNQCIDESLSVLAKESDTPEAEYYKVFKRFSREELNTLSDKHVALYTDILVKAMIEYNHKYSIQLLNYVAKLLDDSPKITIEEILHTSPYFNKELSFQDYLQNMVSSKNIGDLKYSLLELGALAGSLQPYLQSPQLRDAYIDDIIQAEMVSIIIILGLPLSVAQIINIVSKAKSIEYTHCLNNYKNGYEVGIEWATLFQRFSYAQKIELFQSCMEKSVCSLAQVLQLCAFTAHELVKFLKTNALLRARINAQAVSEKFNCWKSLIQIVHYSDFYHNTGHLEKNDGIWILKFILNLEVYSCDVDYFEYFTKFELQNYGLNEIDVLQEPGLEVLHPPIVKRLLNSGDQKDIYMALSVLPIEKLFTILRQAQSVTMRSQNHIDNVNKILSFTLKARLLLNESKIGKLLDTICFATVTPEIARVAPQMDNFDRYLEWFTGSPLHILSLNLDPGQITLYLSLLQHTPAQIKDTFDKLQERLQLGLGNEHLLYAAVKEFNHLDLTEPNNKLKASRYLSWIFNAMLNFCDPARQQDLISSQHALHQRMLLELAKFPDPDLKHFLTRKYFEMCSDAKRLNCFYELISGMHFNTTFVAIVLLDFALKDSAIQHQIKTQILARISNSYNDGAALRTMLNAAQQAVVNPAGINEKMFLLACEKILNNNTSATSTLSTLPSKRIKREVSLFTLLSTILQIDISGIDLSIMQQLPIEDALHKIAMLTLNLEPNETKYKYFFENILSKHGSSALFLYKAILSKMQDQKSLTLFRNFIQAVLTPNARDFYKLKHSPNPHMQTITEHSPMLPQWQTNYAVDLQMFNQEFYVNNTQVDNLKLKEFLHDRIVGHQHLPKKDYAIVYKFMSAAAPEQQEILKQVNSHADNPSNNFIKAVFELYNNAAASINPKFSLVQKALGFKVQVELENDLFYLKSYYYGLIYPGSNIKNLRDYSLVFTDNYWTLLRVGSDVVGSCQRLENGSQCLLAFVTAPHIKVIAILTPDKSILMRAMLRLCFDSVTKQPVVHLERIYSANACPQFLQKSLYLFAQYLAQEYLNCAIVHSDMVEDLMPKYSNPITVSHMPDGLKEYVDALRRSTTAPYSIDSSWRLTEYNRFKTQRPEAIATVNAELRTESLAARIC